MAKKRIERNDIASKEVFDNIKDGAIDAKKAVDLLEASLKLVKEAAKATKGGVTGASPKKVKDVEDLNKAFKQSNDILQAKTKIDKELIVQREKLMAQNQELKKDAKDEAVLTKQSVGTLEKAAAETRKLRREREKLNLDTKEGKQRLKEINAAIDKNNKLIERNSDKMKKQRMGIGRYEKALKGLRGGLLRLGAAFGVGFGLSEAKSLITGSIDLFREQQKSIAQVEAGLKSTGGTVGRSLDELKQKASDLQQTTLFGDEQILKEATAQLLTFTNIAGDQFDRTQEAALDLATRLDGDLKSASIQLGKALNDPVANLTALSRSGIQFTKQQKDQIKVLQESGRLAEAQTLILDELNKQYGGSAEAAAKADGGLTQLGNSIGDAKEKLGEIIVDGLRPTIKSLQEFFANLSKDDIKVFLGRLKSAFKVLKLVAEIFLIYKARLIAINVAQKLFAKNTGLLNGGLKDMVKNLKSGASGASGLGKAIKGIGFTAAIALVVEFAKGLYDVASGALRARKELEAINKATQKGNELATKAIESNRKKLKDELDGIRKRLALGEITEDQAKKEELAATRRSKRRLEQSEANFRALNKELALKIHIQKEVARLAEENASNMFIRSIEEQAAIDAEKNKLQKLKEQLAGNNEAIRLLSQAYEGVNQSASDASIALIELGKASNETAKAFVFNFSKAKELKGILQELGLISLESVEVANLEREKRNVAELDYLILLKQIAIEEAKKAGNTQEAIKLEQDLIALQKQRIDAQADLDKKQTNSDAEKQTIDAQADLDKLQLENTKEVEEEKLSIKKEYIDLATDYFIQQADKRIAKIEEEIDAAQKQADFLEQLAVNGNISAQESLAEQNRLIAEANAQKEQEEKRKQQILLVSSILQAYNSNLAAGDDSGTAFTKAVTSSTVISQFIAGLDSFFEGTEDTGTVGNPLDSNGGRIAVLHNNERVLTAEQNKKLGGMSNDQVANVMEQHRLGTLMDGNQLNVGWDNHILVSQLMNVESKLDKVAQAIEDRPVSNLEVGNVMSDYMTWRQRITKGGNTYTKIYKIKE